jgi:hypothetical protein
MCLDQDGLEMNTLQGELIVEPIERKESQFDYSKTKVNVLVRVKGIFRKGAVTTKLFSVVDANTESPSIIDGFKKKGTVSRVKGLFGISSEENRGLNIILHGTELDAISEKTETNNYVTLTLRDVVRPLNLIKFASNQENEPYDLSKTILNIDF